MRSFVLLMVLALTGIGFADDTPGHSKHGSAYDSGMRTKPWEIAGVGDAPFPISTTDPEVQKWFNQGNALLHSFWFEEAERSFRWCLKLDPECAMAYLGLARCGFTWFSLGSPDIEAKDYDRYREFLKQAVKRKYSGTEREQMYIEAYEIAVAKPSHDQVKTLCAELEKVAIKFPDDIEAKAMLALFNIGNGSALANDFLIKQVLAVNPMHPGAHHASIHNWDGISNLQAIDSCELYGKAAPGIGHSLHMPGHVYSKLGMWHEAAIAMDSAARTELRYMNDRLALPFETWNYPHNRNYLCYIQEQLGMANMALQGANDLLRAPKDPELNPVDEGGLVSQGKEAVIRNLLKFERWNDILKPGFVNWGGLGDFDLLSRHFAFTIANAGLGKEADSKKSLDLLKKLIKKLAGPREKADEQTSYIFFFEDIASAMYATAFGDTKEAEKLWISAAKAEQKMRESHLLPNDPPGMPWPVQRLLGNFYYKNGKYDQAIESYDLALEHEPNDGFSLAGLALSYSKLGNTERATHFAGRLEYVWSNADQDLKWLVDVRNLGLNARPVAVTPRPERTYKPQELDVIGPMNWSPFKAPKLEVLDRDGKQVHIEDYRGKNVLLIYFLGDACVHCVGQLKAINDRGTDFANENTVILAVCSATPETLKSSVVLSEVKMNFLSDNNHENARRFSSYDDFEEMELHSTILIDKDGFIRWKRTGGDPFMDIKFLLNELKRINAEVKK
ncbi:MAG: redoxin domain-containing protein [Fimbriimonadaceae bacterium]|nr:MAG: redoxin domain-containing protein [Fimbriimonadaceae bacterium]